MWGGGDPRTLSLIGLSRSGRRARHGSNGVVEDDAGRVALAGQDPADAVPEIDAVESRCPLHRTVMYGEDYAVALAEGNHHRSRLHLRAPRGDDEFTASEIAARFRKQDGELEREDMLAIRS